MSEIRCAGRFHYLTGGGFIHNSEIRHAVSMGGMRAMLLALIQLEWKGHVTHRLFVSR